MQLLMPCLALVQVWNVNRYSGIVGAFHLQGASWSRTRRQFLVHDETPPPLATQVRCRLSPPPSSLDALMSFVTGQIESHNRLSSSVLALSVSPHHSAWVACLSGCNAQHVTGEGCHLCRFELRTWSCCRGVPRATL